MRFSGYWVYEDDGQVVLKRADFDDTELDPDTDWQQAWQNQDPASAAKGYLRESDALACAALLLAHGQAVALSDGDIAEIQAGPALFSDGQCRIGSLDELRLLSAAMKLRGDLRRARDDASAVRAMSASSFPLDAEEIDIPFPN